MIAKQTNKQTNKEKINNTDRLDNKRILYSCNSKQ